MRHPHWQDQGEDPDYRFSMANERTFLAWLRTALALMAASVAVAQLLPSFGIAGARTALGVLLACMGIGVAVVGYARWEGAERAMRLSRPVRYTISLPLLSAAMATIGVFVLLLVVVGRS